MKGDGREKFVFCLDPVETSTMSQLRREKYLTLYIILYQCQVNEHVDIYLFINVCYITYIIN